MSSITTGNAEQYADSRKLAARARLNSHYTIAATGWFEWVASQLPLRARDRVLDVGCGPGWFWAAAEPIAPAELRLTLLDLSAGMVGEAVTRCATAGFNGVEGETADATALPFAAETFDAVIAMHMLYHVADQMTAISEAWRVLKPGGFLAVTTNGIGNMREIYALTTRLGSAPIDPAAAAFGFDDAKRLMRAAFGNVTASEHPAHLRVTEPEDLILAMTSFPPGDRASEAELQSFRGAVAEAFDAGGGVLESAKETGLFISRKAA
ncbi:class I SAM-dependent methyltransferase [Kaistia dalseonensis]|uniref:SAM-dependent methyltransferase n=1 Tax=Kaistia dalseonensis TaxID=410840 RepID=A0ABU0HBH1_9HYPH|nr:class I SAM-dependent methyltransferase [Kaistia dalseonensis]MCX5497032.1 class I SAM-dependent methyltransferase [Kaistia dalseonensis]MDQ0439658.1 SAM-dependent methyltransferase [Kaistia dalseonensis]